MASEATVFLRESVYPKLDLINSEILSTLRPTKGMKVDSAITLKCPVCLEPGRAFIYPGSSYINCNRGNDCGAKTSLWDSLVLTGTDPKEVFSALCKAANVEPPKREDISNTALYLTKKAIATAAVQNPQPVARFCKERSITEEQFKSLDYGYYPGRKWIENFFSSISVDPRREDLSGALDKYMTKRICAVWTQKDNGVALWGRGFDDELINLPFDKKYRFSPGLSKMIPYGFSAKSSFIVGCEGTIDADSLKLLGVNASAFGQSFVNHAQALFLQNNNISSVTLIVDGDRAGRDGIIKSIENLEPLGISTKFVILSDRDDDPDLMRRKGKGQELIARIEDANSAGEVIADFLINAQINPTSNLRSAIPRLLRLRSILTPASNLALSTKLAIFNVKINPPESDALRLAATLIESGLSVHDALKFIETKHNIKIEVSTLL